MVGAVRPGRDLPQLYGSSVLWAGKTGQVPYKVPGEATRAAGRREAGCGYGARAGRAARNASMVLAGLNVRITVPEEFTNTAVTCSAGFALWSWPAP